MRRGARDSTALAVGDVASPFGTLLVACSVRGLQAVSLPNEPETAFRARLGVAPVAESEDARRLVEQARAELSAYFAARLQRFSMPLDLQGTPFQQTVWQAVAAIPFGETRSYGQLAAQLGRPPAARAVGHANGANPAPIVVPCHRLVGSNGSLTGYAGGLEMKRALLAHERRAPG